MTKKIFCLQTEASQQGGKGYRVDGLSYTLGTSHPPAVCGDLIRRITPREAERLMGFADDYTLIHFKGKPATAAPRYKAIGNSIAVPCLAWIGERIQMVDDLMRGQA